ncbi:MAG: hypothetical protein HYY46_04725 [Deltaproteobacteria bacterium]|nr:hypothetical protein [Deltaproteobacteria bacterium]
MAANSPKKRRGVGNAAVPANGFTEIKDVISQMESFIKEAEALATMEIRRIDEIKESLKASAARLSTLFREKEEIRLTREKAAKELEETFSTKIRDLERQVKETETLLEAREERPAESESKPAPSSFAPKTAAAQSEPSIRELEEGLLQRTYALRRDGETQGGSERYATESEVRSGGPAVRELEMRAGKGDQHEPELKSSRLVSLLAPIKRKS